MSPGLEKSLKSMMKLDCGGRSGAGSSFLLQPVDINENTSRINPDCRMRFLIDFMPFNFDDLRLKNLKVEIIGQ